MYHSPEYLSLLSVAKSYNEMLSEKTADEKGREKVDKSMGGTSTRGVRQGNRLPLKNDAPIQRRNKGESASPGSTFKGKKGQGRKSTVDQPKGHEAAKRNQAYGGESDAQYNPKKYEDGKKVLRGTGGKGAISSPKSGPYKANSKGETKTRGFEGNIKTKDVENMMNKASLEKASKENVVDYVGSTKKQKDVAGRQLRKSMDKSMDAKAKRPKSRMPKHNSPGTMKK